MDDWGNDPLVPVAGGDWGNDALRRDVKIAPDALAKGRQKGRVETIPISQFLRLAPELKTDPDTDRKERSLSASLDSGEAINELPQLRIENGKVTFADGRHRALALANAGYTEIPVIFEGDLSGLKSVQAQESKDRVILPFDTGVSSPVSRIEQREPILKGLGEAAATLALAAPAAVAGGLAGLVGSVLPGPAGQGARVSQAVQEMVPQPETALGKGIVGAVSWPFEKLSEGAQAVGSKVMDITGSPVAATAAQTALEAGPQLALGALAKTKAPGGVTPAQAAARAGEQSRRAVVDAAAKQAQAEGYVLPPTQVSPTAVNKAVEGFGGKIKTAQDLSLRNQEVTDSLVRRHFGIDLDAPITPELLADIRAAAGRRYEEVRSFGLRETGPEYAEDLNRIVQPYVSAAIDFPEAGRPDVIRTVNSLRVPQFDVSAAVDQIRVLRNEADKAYAGKDKILGKTYRDLAYALEDEIGRKVEEWGDAASPDVIRDFQEARRVIAESYTVQDALKASGNIDAKALARNLEKGVPLRGDLRKVATFAANFPKAAQLPKGIGGVPLSPLDIGFAVGVGGLAGLVPFTRPFARNVMASRIYQNRMVQPPSYGPTLANRLLALQQQPTVPLAEIALGQQQ